MLTNSVLPLLVEVCTYIFVIYGFTGLSTLLHFKKPHISTLKDLLFSGFILYLVFFVIIRWLQIPRDQLVVILTMFLLVGYISLILYLSKNIQFVRKLLISIPIIIMFYLGFYLIPLFIFGIDPQHYAMDMSAAMNLDWVNHNASALGIGSSFFIDTFHYNRAGVSALGWLNNLSNISIDPGSVQRQILFYFAFTIIQFAQILFIESKKLISLASLQKLPFFLIFVGAHYLLSLSIGQLNAAIGIFLLVSIVLEIIQLNQTSWRWLSSWRLTLLGFLLLVNYTELVLMLPLFVIIGFLWFDKIVVKCFFKTLISLYLGIVCVFVLKFSVFYTYLFGQGHAAVGYYPLGNDFSVDLLNITSNIVSSVSSRLYGLSILFTSVILLTVFTIGSFKSISNPLKTNRQGIIGQLFLVWIFIFYYVTLLYSAISMTSNPNYMVFKLSSWTAPLIALGLYVVWYRIMKTNKIIKIPLFIFTSYITIFSLYNSSQFALITFINSSYQSLPVFAANIDSIAIQSRPDISYGRSQPLYDPAWILHLAAWRNLPISPK